MLNSQGWYPDGYFRNTLPVSVLSLGGNAATDEELGSELGSGGQQGGRPDYLNWLGGFTKLMELQGSFNANTDETKVTMAWAEARWMASHWQDLEVVEFFEQDEEPTEPFLRLKEQCKDRLLNLTGQSKSFFSELQQCCRNIGSVTRRQDEGV